MRKDWNGIAGIVRAAGETGPEGDARANGDHNAAPGDLAKEGREAPEDRETGSSEAVAAHRAGGLEVPIAGDQIAVAEASGLIDAVHVQTLNRCPRSTFISWRMKRARRP